MKKKRGKKKEQFSFKREYKKSFDYIQRSKEFIYMAILIFFIFVLIGFCFQDIVNLFFSTFLGVDLNGQIMTFFNELIDKTANFSSLSEWISFIFFNNIQGSFFGMIFGILFGFFTLIFIIVNGYILGFVAMLSVKSEGFLVLWRLLPHGIFELPAIFISLGLGLKLGTFIFQRNKTKSFKHYLLNSLRVFLFIVIPLLIIAAIIEGSLIFLFE